MSRTCSICIHPQREEIDKQLLSGTSYRDIAGQFGTSKSSLERHRSEGHIAVDLAQAHEVQEIARADDLLAELRELRQRTYDLLDKAEEAGSVKVFGAPAAYLRELRELIKLRLDAVEVKKIEERLEALEKAKAMEQYR